ncbi:MAG TPA: alpha-glucosidase, partial [Sphingomonas sp.]|nr:alpha-glucosidase [Sphingomonas sp.]
GSAMLVDLARGGWRPEPYRRGVWLFPPREGPFSWSAVEDSGDGDGPVDIWHLSGRAEPARIVVDVRRDGPGSWGDSSITLLLPPNETRPLVVNGGAGNAVDHDGRRGVTLTL